MCDEILHTPPFSQYAIILYGFKKKKRERVISFSNIQGMHLFVCWLDAFIVSPPRGCRQELMRRQTRWFLGVIELKLERERLLEEKTVKVRTSNSHHKVKDHNAAKQIGLCVYLWLAVHADLALWWEWLATLRRTPWRSCRERQNRIRPKRIDT